MAEASDQEREMIKKEKSQPSEASIKDYKSEDKAEVAKTAIDETPIEYTEVKPSTARGEAGQREKEGKMKEEVREGAE